MNSLKRKIILWLIETRIYNSFVRDILPKIYISKKKNISFQETRFLLEDILSMATERGMPGLEGCVLSSRDPSKLSGRLIPTDLDHSALILGYSPAMQDYVIIEAVGAGVRKSVLTKFMRECESFTIHVGEKWDLDYRKKMAEFSLRFLFKPYDRKFQFGAEALYCSEICYHSDFEKRCKYDISDFAGIGREYISPSGVAEAVGMLKLYDSLIPRI